MKRKFHNAKRTWILRDSVLTTSICEFMNVDFTKENLRDFKLNHSFSAKVLKLSNHF